MNPEQQAIAKAFGGQEVDLYGMGELRAQLARNQVSTPNAPSVSQPDILANVAAQAAAEVTGTSWEAAKETHEHTKQLFETALPHISVPDLAEFATAGVDFEHLQQGYEGYEAAGMKPELILAPVNLPLDGDSGWRALYSNLRQWQDGNDPDSDFRLKRQDDGDGLWVWENVASEWHNLAEQATTETPGHKVITQSGIVWKALVVPTGTQAEGGLATNTSHDLTTQSPVLSTQADAAHIAGDVLTPQDVHMPTAGYLTLQASRVMTKQPLMHEVISGLYAYTWLNGTFNNESLAPAAVWFPDGGQVYVGYADVGGSGDYLGARVPVWG